MNRPTARPQDLIHALAWMLWLGAILVALTATRNPLYIAFILLWIALVTAVARAAAPPLPGQRTTMLSPLRFGLVVVTLSALFNALSVHIGVNVLFRLPRTLPLIGGIVTVEALLYGALNGLVITGLFAAFSVINYMLPVRALIQLIPRAYYSLAVVVSIAITFVPTTLREIQLIREAQAVRGHNVTGLRGWLPLMMPLLIGGLERALQLAEAMMARGFASSEPASHEGRARLTMTVGLLIFTGGWLLRLVWGRRELGLLLLLAGLALMLASLWVAGRRHPHTVYRPAPWKWGDWLVVLGALITASAFLAAFPGIDRSSIFYSPYPRLTLPTFDLVVGVASWGLLAPALVLAAGKWGTETSGKRSPEATKNEISQPLPRSRSASNTGRA